MSYFATWREYERLRKEVIARSNDIDTVAILGEN
jgi:hypothetical protein